MHNSALACSAGTVAQATGVYVLAFAGGLLYLHAADPSRSGALKLILLAVGLAALPGILLPIWIDRLVAKLKGRTLRRTYRTGASIIAGLCLLSFITRSTVLLLLSLLLGAVAAVFFSRAQGAELPATTSAITEITSAHLFFAFVAGFLALLTAAGLASSGLLQPVAAFAAILLPAAGFTVMREFAGCDAGKQARTSPRNPFVSLYRDLVSLRRSQPLWLANSAKSYFTFWGLLMLLNTLGQVQHFTGPRAGRSTITLFELAVLASAGAVGAMLAHRWSGRKIELGLVPLGGAGMALSGVGLSFAGPALWLRFGLLCFAGLSIALYLVPLQAFTRFATPQEEISTARNAATAMNAAAVLLGLLAYTFLANILHAGASHIYLAAGLLTAVAVVYICTIIPEYFIRFCGWLLTHTFYRITIEGAAHVPEKGPALLAPNHVSYVDAFLIGSTMQRFIRYVMLKSYYKMPLARLIFKIMDTIPIAPEEGRAAVVASLRRAREKLLEGHLVCIFPEGGLTRDGTIQPFKPGLETVMQGLDCPIIPVYMHNVWGSIFSYERRKLFWKWPRRIPYPITVAYGEPLPAAAKAGEVEVAVRALARRFEGA